MNNNTQLLDYLITHPDATIQYRAFNMILNIHSDALYLSKKNAKSHALGHFWLDWLSTPNHPIELKDLFSPCACF